VTDNLEATGFWHFQADPENSFAGNLKKEDGDISITLLGCTEVPPEPFIVHGTTATGNKITLFKCHQTNRRMSFPGISSIEISAVYCITGGHLSFEELSFNSVLLKVSSLNEWVDIGGFQNFKNDDESFSISYVNPKPIIFYRTKIVKFVLLFHRISPMFKPRHDCTLKQETVILIKHKEKFDLDTFWEYASTIKSFLTLAYFSEPQILEIKFKRGQKTLELKYVGQSTEAIEEKKNKRNFLFTYKSIERDFVAVFKKWTELNTIIEPVVNVLLEAFGNRNIINENKFLNVMQGIETFHRRRRHNEKDPRETHKIKMKQIVGSCPPEHQNWLKEKLNFSNEPTLQDRLKELFAEIDETLKNHLFPGVDEIIKSSKDSRNYYTHYSNSLEKKALKDTPLFYLTERLKIFLLILLLKETGFSNDQANIIVKEGSHFLFNHLIAKTYNHSLT
jgi:hypothetical protein